MVKRRGLRHHPRWRRLARTGLRGPAVEANCGESMPPDPYRFPIAQSVERTAVSRQVTGSSPVGGVLDQPAKAGRLLLWNGRVEPAGGLGVSELAGLAGILAGERQRASGPTHQRASRRTPVYRELDQPRPIVERADSSGPRVHDIRAHPRSAGSMHGESPLWVCLGICQAQLPRTGSE